MTANHDASNALSQGVIETLSDQRVISFLNSLRQPVYFEFVGDVPPRRAYVGDAGLDIALQRDVTIYPGDTEYVPAGIKVHVPEGLAVVVMTRTSAFKHRVSVIPTLVDQSYTGEISTIVKNDNSYPISLPKGTMLAQAVIQPYRVFDNELGYAQANERGEKKFGSSSPT